MPSAADGPTVGQTPRREIPEPRIPSLAVVDNLDVLRDLSLSLLPGCRALMMYEFILQCPLKAFHRRIVVAIAPA